MRPRWSRVKLGPMRLSLIVFVKRARTKNAFYKSIWKCKLYVKTDVHKVDRYERLQRLVNNILLIYRTDPSLGKIRSKFLSGGNLTWHIHLSPSFYTSVRLCLSLILTTLPLSLPRYLCASLFLTSCLSLSLCLTVHPEFIPDHHPFAQALKGLLISRPSLSLSLSVCVLNSPSFVVCHSVSATHVADISWDSVVAATFPVLKKLSTQ